MQDENQPFNPEPRRLKLDELFGDNPFLSPTMKARRLHEKLREDQSSGLPPEVVVKEPASSLQDDAEAWPADPEICAKASEGTASAEEAPSGERRIDFSGAADVLRTEGLCDAMPPLRRFREQVLQEWLNGAPPRED